MLFAAVEAMALKHVLDPAVEPLDHAAGHCPWADGGRSRALRPHRGRKTVLDAEFRAKQVELVLSGSRALAQTEQPVGEGLAIVGQHPGDLHRGRGFQIA